MGAVGHKILCNMCNTARRVLARKFPFNTKIGRWRCEVVKDNGSENYHFMRENGTDTEHLLVTNRQLLCKFREHDEGNDECKEKYEWYLQHNPQHIPFSEIPADIKKVFNKNKSFYI